jgi:hypothetical protein
MVNDSIGGSSAFAAGVETELETEAETVGSIALCAIPAGVWPAAATSAGDGACTGVRTSLRAASSLRCDQRRSEKRFA